MPSSTNSASPTIRSCCTRRITARITTPGRMRASRRSAVEKNTNWEGGWRVPAFVRWPGKIQAGTVFNDIASSSGLAAYPARRRRRGGHRGQTTSRSQGRRQDLQGPHRRLQHDAVPDRRGEGEPQASSSSISVMTATSWASAWVTGKSCSWSSGRRHSVLVRAVRAAARAENVPSSPRPVRASGREFQHLLGLVTFSRLYHVRDARRRLQADRSFMAFPPRQKPASFNLDAVLRKLQEANSSANH